MKKELQDLRKSNNNHHNNKNKAVKVYYKVVLFVWMFLNILKVKLIVCMSFVLIALKIGILLNISNNIFLFVKIAIIK